MRKCYVVLAVTLLVALAAAPSSAVTIRVPDHQPTIQAGVNAAGEGDTVLVAPGTYTGEGNRDVTFTGVNIVLTSEAGAAATVLDCGGLSRGIRVVSGEDSTSVVRGLTVTGAYTGSGRGGGIQVEDAAAIIEDCIIHDCFGSNGGGIYMGYAPTQGIIRNCVVYGNTARFRGGGIFCSHGDPPEYVPAIIRDCVIYNNDESNDNPYGGGGIYCSDSNATIVGCTVVGNTGEPGRGTVYGHSCYPVVRRTVIAFNNSGPGIYNVDADHCIIHGNPGDALPSGRDRENLDADPLFCHLGNWELTVCADSPCLAGDPENPWGEHIGALDSGCPSCDSVVEETTWGSIKALFGRP